MRFIEFVAIVAMFLCAFDFYEPITRAIVVALSGITAIFSAIALWQLKNWNAYNFKSEKEILLNYHKGSFFLETGIVLIFVKKYFPSEQVWDITAIVIAVLLWIIGLVYLTRYYKLCKA